MGEVFQVHRVELNDPSLKCLDFGCFHLPRGGLFENRSTGAGDSEPRQGLQTFESFVESLLKAS